MGHDLGRHGWLDHPCFLTAGQAGCGTQLEDTAIRKFPSLRDTTTGEHRVKPAPAADGGMQLPNGRNGLARATHQTRMSNSKKRSGSDPLAGAAARLRGVIGFAVGRGRRMTLTALLLTAFVVGWCFAWRGVQDRVLGAPDFLIGPQQVEITPPPAWIHSDVRAEVFRGASLDRPLSIMDERLTEQMAAAFSLHPWVAKVNQVRKHHPARLVVELEYRRPVMMVDTPGGLLPVDGHGSLLPTGDFSSIEAAAYPRLVGVDTAPVGTIGQPWGDARVAGAAMIARAIGPRWRELDLAEIAAIARAEGGQPDDFLYALRTRTGVEILWGRAFRAAAAGESPTEGKVAKLVDLVSRYGALGELRGAGVIDLR